MEGSETGRSQREQFQAFVDDWAKCANAFINSSATLAKRVVRQQGGDEGAGDIGLQDFWMAMASAAGDMAELSYKWVQAVDGLAGFASNRRSQASSHSGGAKKEEAPDPAGSSDAPDPETRRKSGTRPEDPGPSFTSDGD
jgi:hypothetical protein